MLAVSTVLGIGQLAAGSTVSSSAVTSSHPPQLRALSPSFGPVTGGVFTYIAGRFFSKSTKVSFGSHSAQIVQVLSSTRLRVLTPAGRGTVYVRVHTTSGTSLRAAVARFTYGSAATAALEAISSNSQNAVSIASPAATTTMTTSPDSSSTTTTTPGTSNGAPDHVVVVVMENYGYNKIIGGAAAPYTNLLAAQGALFTNSYAVSHPSEPNYLSMYSGSTHGTDGSDNCLAGLTSTSLGGEAKAGGISIKGFFEGLGTGNPDTNNGLYVCRHNPMAQFSDSAGLSTDFTNFPTDYSQLPKISMVVPNTVDDMHDQGVGPGDSWLQLHIDSYAQWAKTHNSLLIVTWDEADLTVTSNQVATIFVGQSVKVATYGERIDHTNVLATIDNLFGLPDIGSQAITDVFNP